MRRPCKRSLAPDRALPQAGYRQLNLRGKIALNLLNLGRNRLRSGSVAGEPVGTGAECIQRLADGCLLVLAYLWQLGEHLRGNLKRGRTLYRRGERIVRDFGARRHDRKGRCRAGRELLIRSRSPLVGAECHF